MAKKYDIQVRNGNGTIVKTIKTCIRVESIGNFAPLFCTYNGDKRCLVESDTLHLDDPLRCCEKDHIGKLFIRPRDKTTGRVVETWNDVSITA